MNTAKNMMHKQAQTQMWWIILAALIAIIVAISIVIWFRSSGEKAVGGLGENIDKLKDADNDGVADLFDRCASTPAGADVDAKGCTGEQAAALKIEPPKLETGG